MEYQVEGSCQCGQLTYTLREKPKMVIACHCQECQKLATAPFSVTALVSADAIEFRGELKEWSRSSDSGNTNGAKFCPGCGNRVYHFNPDDLSVLKLKLKPVGLEDQTLFEPSAHVWVSEKQDWYTIPDGVKVFDKQP
ncbi:GFA family protein [Vibrio tapetis]|uniref:Putative lipoprotein n=1 Tax=Vibrio tapetis subsp. tapetis TaxID=1671868 RepID=A0A2N8ZLU2_9VIBR|nr:GFA family protein [Vibrio tapetis]SON52868.1 putative lipoprotein [Vibrio tapetis subsp. tapetis]